MAEIKNQTLDFYYHLLYLAAGFSELVAVAAIAGIYFFNPIYFNSNQYLSTVGTIFAAGAIFCFVGWFFLKSKAGNFINTINGLIFVGGLLTLIYFTGGISSVFYLFWIIVIITSGVFNLGSVLTITVVTIFYYFLLFVIGGINHLNLTGSWVQFGATVGAFIIAILTSYQIGKMRKSMILAEGVVGQLDSEKMGQQLMMSFIADAIIGVDKNRQVILFNGAAERLTSWDKKSAMGINYNTIFKLRDENDKELTDNSDPFLKVFRTGNAFTTDSFYMLTKDNEKISLSISIAPTFDNKKQINGAIAIFHDISEQKAVQRERNEFVSTASHEMRSPVATLEAYLSMALNPKMVKMDAKGKGYVNQAHEASIRLGGLIRDLLSVTKIEDKRLAEKKQVFNFSELLLNVISDMRVIAIKKGLDLGLHVGNKEIKGETVAIPAYKISADPDRLREVLTNLIDNAIKFTAKGSVDIYLTSDKQFITVSIADTGMGISTEDQKHLFQKFYRVDSSMTREIGGTGLGLYIARNLIELYGGRIWVESEADKGSKFSFSLPVVK
ncbi:MAG: ATP-binding protein [bacterium]|nr:ATP-binding protein [bacterium]